MSLSLLDIRDKHINSNLKRKSNIFDWFNFFRIKQTFQIWRSSNAFEISAFCFFSTYVR